MRFSAGASASSKWMLAVSDIHQPIFFSRVRDTPGRSASMRRKESPPAPAAPVRTATVR